MVNGNIVYSYEASNSEGDFIKSGLSSKDTIMFGVSSEDIIRAKGFYGRVHLQEYLAKVLEEVPLEIYELLGYVNGCLKGLDFYEISVEIDSYGMLLVRASVTEPEDSEVVLECSVFERLPNSFLGAVARRLLKSFNSWYGVVGKRITMITISSKDKVTNGYMIEDKYIGYALKKYAGRDFSQKDEVAVCVLV